MSSYIYKVQSWYMAKKENSRTFRSYMMIGDHRDQTFYQFPWFSMTFRDLPCPSSQFLQSSSKFYDLPVISMTCCNRKFIRISKLFFFLANHKYVDAAIQMNNNKIMLGLISWFWKKLLAHTSWNLTKFARSPPNFQTWYTCLITLICSHGSTKQFLYEIYFIIYHICVVICSWSLRL